MNREALTVLRELITAIYTLAAVEHRALSELSLTWEDAVVDVMEARAEIAGPRVGGDS